VGLILDSASAPAGEGGRLHGDVPGATPGVWCRRLAAAAPPAEPSSVSREARMPDVGSEVSHYRIVDKLGEGGPAFARRPSPCELRRGLAV